MNRYDLDFKNVFQIIGIKEFDREYLLKECNLELNSAKTAIAANRYSVVFQIKLINADLKKLVDPAKSISEKKDIIAETRKHRDELLSLKFKGKDEVLASIDNCIDSVENSLEHENEMIRIVHESSRVLEKLDGNVVSEARMQRDEIDKYFLELSDTSNTDILLIWHLIQLKSAQIIRKAQTDKLPLHSKKSEDAEVALVIKNMFSTPAALEKYIRNDLKVIQYTDIENADMHKYAYQPRNIIPSVVVSNGSRSYTSRKLNPEMLITKPPYTYTIQMNQKPARIFKEQIAQRQENEDYLEAFEFGRFEFGMFIRDDGKPSYRSSIYDLVGVIREDEENKLQSYYGIIDINRTIDPRFYFDLAFSNMALRNAKKNNFGFIGTNIGIKSSDSEQLGNILGFKYVCSTDLIAALSYALNNPGTTNIKSIQDLHDAYEYVDSSLKERIRILSSGQQIVEIPDNITTYDEDGR